MSNKELQRKEDDILASLILKGDLSNLQPNERVIYYKGYCERLGLDPFTKPFEILRLQGRETLYLSRSGAQQLNKLHGVSHQITSRQLIESAGIYEVTARAILPDGRYTESMAAVSVANQKGEQYCNSIMKAETKAKRRSTLDLLGLGVLDETEVHSIIESGQDAQVIPMGNKLIDNSVNRIISQIANCKTVEELTKVYNDNKKLVHDAGIIDQFTKRKTEITG
jgi:hypothetical protein